jgi:GDP/UDP-N,N'-diacetylbacillosamine 2-epimerase (hydrolysing)
MKIVIITGSRAEWGLLRPLVQRLEPLLFVTGSHLSPEFGETWRQIDYPIAEKIECVLSSRTPNGVTMSMGLAAIGFGMAFERYRPDLVVVLGDRYEIFAAVSAAHVAGIPVAHIHGGEVTEGSYDDGFRHSITKMSQLHFTAAEEYRQRVIQMGEHPAMVFNVGALGCDGLEKRAYRPPGKPGHFILAHYGIGADDYEFPEGSLVVRVFGSHDVSCMAGSRSMPRDAFLRELMAADAIIGNSSSGIVEAPALGVPTINVGDRQKGRLMATSIIHCESPKSLPLALDNLYSDFFQGIMASDYHTPYKGGNVAEKIADIILGMVGKIEVKKPFWEVAA